MALSDWDTYAVEYEIRRTYASKAILRKLREEHLGSRTEMSDVEFAAAQSRWEAALAAHQPVTITTRPSDGTFRSPAGTEISVYKNWLYVSDEKMWHDGLGWSEPTIAQITEGRCRVNDLHIDAYRGPQNGVYALVTHSQLISPSDDEHGDVGSVSIETGMIACGVNGHETFQVPRTLRQIWAWTCENDRCTWALPIADLDAQDDPPHTICPDCDSPVQRYPEQFSPTNNNEYPWVGVQDSSLRWFAAKLALEHDGENVLKVDLFAGQRHNQGDAFFASHFGIDIPATDVGDSDTPIINDAIRGLTASQTDHDDA